MERFRKILLSVDRAKARDAAYERAVGLCKRTGAKLEMLAVVPELSVYLRYPQLAYPSLEQTLEAEVREALSELATRAREHGVDVTTAVRHGKPFLEIARQALASGSDLVIVSAEGDDALRRSTSTAMRLFRVCPCPVWAVRPKHAGPYRRILAAVDPGAPSSDERGLNEQILELALSLGALESARVEALHAWRGEHGGDELRERVGEAARQSLDAVLAPYGGDFPADAVHLIEGDPGDSISSFVEQNGVDLLVIGTLVRTGVAGLLIGNTAERVLGQVDCSVLALKPPGFRSPVEAG